MDVSDHQFLLGLPVVTITCHIVRLREKKFTIKWFLNKTSEDKSIFAAQLVRCT